MIERTGSGHHETTRRSVAPIVLGCAPSSGSTLLRVVLGRLPAVQTGGELNIMDRAELFDVDSATIHRELGTWLDRGCPRSFVSGAHRVFARAHHFGWQFDELVAAAQSCRSWGALLQAFFEGSVIRSRTRRWMEKTPGNVFGFHRALEFFPEALFVHLLRDGRDVVASLMRRGHGPFLAVSRWMVAVAAGRRLSTLEACHEMRYERLVTEPSIELQSLCAFLAERFDASLLEPDAEDASPAVPSWQLAEGGPISQYAVGSYLRSDPEAILSHMAAVRLSEHGHALLDQLPGRDAIGDATALDLLEIVGYDGDRPAPAPLSSEAVHRGRAEFSAYRRREIELYGEGIYRCPTRLSRR